VYSRTKINKYLNLGRRSLSRAPPDAKIKYAPEMMCRHFSFGTFCAEAKMQNLQSFQLDLMQAVGGKRGTTLVGVGESYWIFHSDRCKLDFASFELESELSRH
jgi:hypothetical protein